MDTAQRERFDPGPALDGLLAGIGLERSAAGGSVTFAGADPIIPSRHRLGACIGIPMMAAALGAAAFGRRRGLAGQDLHLDLRRAIHGVNPSSFWRPTLGGEAFGHPLVLDDPFLMAPFRTADGRTVMACGVYPHQVAQWCRFLDVPPDFGRVAAAFARWEADNLEDTANAAGLPLTIARTPAEWLAHPQGELLAAEPVISMVRVGDAPILDPERAARPLDGIRVLSFTHAIAGPVAGRTLAEQGADVLCATRPNDYEHEFIYDEANPGSRSAWIDLATPSGREQSRRLLANADVVINNHRGRKLEDLGLDPHLLAGEFPGIISVSITCYGSKGPWAQRGGFDMNASAASGLMAIEGSPDAPRLPVTGMVNDFITGYLAAAGATAALVRRADEGGSWRVEVNLTRAAMWYQSLGFVGPATAGSGPDHALLEPHAICAETPLGRLHTLAPQVEFSVTPGRWRDPVLVPRGSSEAEWLGAG